MTEDKTKKEDGEEVVTTSMDEVEELGEEKKDTSEQVVVEDKKVDAEGDDVMEKEEEQVMEEAPSNEQSDDKVSINKVVVAIIAIALLVAGVIYTSGKSAVDGDTLQSNVVATVNGDTISESEVAGQLAQVEAAFSAQGQTLTDDIRDQMRSDTLDALIGQKLIKQEAERMGLSASDEEVTEIYINEVLPIYGGEESFMEVLSTAGITKEDVFSDIRQQIVMEQFIAEVVDTSLIEISDEEARVLYDDTALRLENLPPFEEVIEEIKASLYEQAVTEQIIAIVDDLRADADVIIE